MIAAIALRNYVAVYAFIAMTVIVGLHSYLTLPREASPDIKIPIVLVVTTYAGVAAADMERLVTRELEAELKNLNDVKEMRSSSSESVSVITLEFEAGGDIAEAVRKTREKVDIAKAKVPREADEPEVDEISFSDIPMMIVNVSGAYGLVKLKEFAESIADRIERIEGVLRVDMAGGLEREAQIDVDPKRLEYYQFSFRDLIDAVAEENVTIPGGSIEVGRYNYQTRAPGEFVDLERIADIPLGKRAGSQVFLRDLAEVKFGFKKRSSIARLDGVDTISLLVKKRVGENVIQIADEIRALLGEELKRAPRTTKFVITADTSKETRTLVRDLENNIITGLILVLLILFITLELKVAFFVAMAIPMSMLMSFAVFDALGYTINMVMLFSLILALGMLVDNSIVIVENIYRMIEEGRSPRQAAIEGTSEVAYPVIFSTLTTLCAFAPLLFWPGIVGEFMYYLPFTLIVTLTASLIVALLINPVLCGTLLKARSVAPKRPLTEIEDHQLPRLYRLYKALAAFAIRRSGATLGIAFSVLALTALVYGFFGRGLEFFPQIDPNTIYVDVEGPVGLRLEETDKFAKIVEESLKSDRADIRSYVTNVGVSTGVFDMAGEGPSHKARVAIDFIDREKRNRSSVAVQEKLRAEISDKIVGARLEIKSQEHGPPTGSPVKVEISGDDYSVIAQLAEETLDELESIDGLIDERSDYTLGAPEISIKVDRERAARYGVRTLDVANHIRWALHGAIVSKYRRGEDEYDILARYKESSRDAISKLDEIFIHADGASFPLSAVAKVEPTAGYSQINHVDQKRVVTVSADVADGYNQIERLKFAQERLRAKIAEPTGYRLNFTGQDKERAEASAFLSKAFLGALGLILFVLILRFNSAATPIIIMSSVILSMIGVFIGLLLTGSPFGIIMTGIGVISLAGVVVNNTIVLLDYTNQLRARRLDRDRAILVAGMTRLRPILLTAVTTILGLSPMALKFSVDFFQMRLIFNSEMAEWWWSMANAVVFGLGFATILTLVVAPSFYRALDQLSERILGVGLLSVDGDE